nr:hypothetical protein [Acidimicrobiia bacterium]
MSARTYRLSPIDRTGVLLGLGTAQVATLGATVVIGVLLLNFGAPVQMVLVPSVVGMALGFIRIEGQSILELIPGLWRRTAGAVAGDKTWYAQVPLVGDLASLPPALDGQV